MSAQSVLASLLAVGAALGILLWSQERTSPTHEDHPELLEQPQDSETGRGTGNAESNRESIPPEAERPSSTAERPQDPAASSAEFVLGLLSGHLQEFNNGHSLRTEDLADYAIDDLRRVIQESNLEADDLRGAIDELGIEDGRCLPALLAFAWVSCSPEDIEWLAHLGTSFSTKGDSIYPTDKTALAAIHALRLRQDESALVDLMGNLVEGGDPRSFRHGVASSGVAIALSGLSAASRDNPKLRTILNALLDESRPAGRSGLFAAWQAAGRLGGPELTNRIFGNVLAGNGVAKEGLESLGDDRHLTELQALVEKPGKTVYDGWVAQSAFKGMLSMDSGAGLELLESYLQDSELSGIAQEAIKRAAKASPSLVGDLLVLANEYAGDHGFRSDIRGCVKRSLQQVAGLKIDSDERTSLRESLRSALPQLPHGSEEHLIALETLADNGSQEDWNIVRSAADGLEPSDRKSILERLAGLERPR